MHVEGGNKLLKHAKLFYLSLINPTEMSYRPDRVERKNRRKAILLTTLIYGGLLAFFLVKDDIAWQEYMPEVVLEVMGESTEKPAVAETAEVRP